MLSYKEIDNLASVEIEISDLFIVSREIYDETFTERAATQAGSGAAFFPSKLLNTLAYARPVLTVADSQSQLAHALERLEPSPVPEPSTEKTPGDVGARSTTTVFDVAPPLVTVMVADCPVTS